MEAQRCAGDRNMRLPGTDRWGEGRTSWLPAVTTWSHASSLPLTDPAAGRHQAGVSCWTGAAGASSGRLRCYFVERCRR